MLFAFVMCLDEGLSLEESLTSVTINSPICSVGTWKTAMLMTEQALIVSLKTLTINKESIKSLLSEFKLSSHSGYSRKWVPSSID
jgi:hypothetical protein